MAGLSLSDVPNRDEVEAELARKLGRLFKAELNDLMDLLGNPPNLANVPDSFWEGQAKEFADAVYPTLEKQAIEQAGNALAALPAAVSWDLVNERAVAWARNYTFDLVRGITETSRDVLRVGVSDYFNDGLTIGELEDKLSSTFGAVRASLISVTEITRAAAAGERALADELAKFGIKMRPIFETNQDELVCARCGPMQGKEIKREEDYPPLHPGCRCFSNLELPEA
jgi:hypothetical protein